MNRRFSRAPLEPDYSRDMAKRPISSRLEVICDADHGSLDIYYTTSWTLPRQYIVFDFSRKEMFGYMAVGSDRGVDVASRHLGLDDFSSFAFVPAPVSGSLVLHHLGSSRILRDGCAVENRIHALSAAG
jgi:hypothetical protein